VPGIAALGVPPLDLDDGPAGVRDGWSFAFPAPIAVAATWNPELAAAYGSALGNDARAKAANVLLGPAIDLARVPTNGRTFEAFGEDPWLASAIAVPEIRAIQATHVIAVAKHYVAYNQQTGAHRADVLVAPRPLHELYLAPFAAAVRDADVGGVMCSYNRIGGDWSCENPVTLGILERELGFAGFVVSDWYAQHDVYKSLFNGLDLEMPQGLIYGDYLTGAVARGNAPMRTIDDHVERILGAMDRVGLLDAPPTSEMLDVAGDLVVARRVASASAVLLKNDGGELPLDPKATQTVAIIGATASAELVGGGGSSFVRALPGTAPGILDALRAAADARMRIVAVDMAPPPFENDAPSIDPLELQSGASPDSNGWTGQYFASADLAGAPTITRVDRRIWFQWGTNPPLPELPRMSSVRWTATLRVRTGGAYRIGADGRCACRLLVDGTTLQDTWALVPGAPSAPLATVDLAPGVAHVVEFEWHSGGDDTVRLAWQPPANAPSPEVAAAVTAARGADRAIVFAGDFETEGRDRATLRLSPDQERTIAAVAAVNPHTTVVLESGGAVVVAPWLANVRALVELWYPGDAGGLAAADVLFGRGDPGGRLPLTFPASDAAVPASIGVSAEPNDGAPRPEPYAEGLDVGYRWYDARDVAPQFPFGFGLSYGRFAFANLMVTRTSAAGDVAVSVDVTNVGPRAGSTVAQLYLSFPPAAAEPPRVLRAGVPLALAPGATQRVRFDLGPQAFRIWDEGEARLARRARRVHGRRRDVVA